MQHLVYNSLWSRLLKVGVMIRLQFKSGSDRAFLVGRWGCTAVPRVCRTSIRHSRSSQLVPSEHQQATRLYEDS